MAAASHVDGRDPVVHFTAKHAGRYKVVIHDVKFSGLQDYVYRLTITEHAAVDWVYPLGGQRGQDVEFELGRRSVDAFAEANKDAIIRSVVTAALTSSTRTLFT